MEWVIAVVLLIAAGLYARRSSAERDRSAPSAPAAPRVSPTSSTLVRASDEQLLRREIEAEATRMMEQIEEDARRMAEETFVVDGSDSSWPSVEEDEDLAVAERPVLSRIDYVAKVDERRYLNRRGDGSADLRLVDAGDTLAIWSPVDGGGLINPKGPGLRSLGLYTSYARGSDHYLKAYRRADLRMGRWIELVREPENPHDKNAVAMRSPDSSSTFAYVQRGRAPAIARRMDAGESMAAVSLRGPSSGRDDETTSVLIGTRSDLAAMLDPGDDLPSLSTGPDGPGAGEI